MSSWLCRDSTAWPGTEERVDNARLAVADQRTAVRPGEPDYNGALGRPQDRLSP